MDGQTDGTDNKSEEQNPQIVDIAPPAGSPQTDIEGDDVISSISSQSDANQDESGAVLNETVETPILDEVKETAPESQPETADAKTIDVQVDSTTSGSENTDKPQDGTMQMSTTVSPVVPPPPAPQGDAGPASESSPTSAMGETAGAVAAAGTTAVAASKSKKHVSIVPIVAALVVAIGLAVLTVFAYKKTRPSQGSSSSQSTSATTASNSTTEPLKQDDVSSTLDAANEALTSDDAADADPNELTDTTLGL